MLVEGSLFDPGIEVQCVRGEYIRVEGCGLSGEGHQPGVCVPLKALFLVYSEQEVRMSELSKYLLLLMNVSIVSGSSMNPTHQKKQQPHCLRLPSLFCSSNQMLMLMMLTPISSAYCRSFAID